MWGCMFASSVYVNGPKFDEWIPNALFHRQKGQQKVNVQITDKSFLHKKASTLVYLQ